MSARSPVPSPAPPTTDGGYIARPTRVAASDCSARSVTLPARKAPPGATMSVASGWTGVAEPNLNIRAVASVKQARPRARFAANPNPCRIERRRADCTTFVRWSTRGVTQAKVYVTDNGPRGRRTREFGSSTACESSWCSAPWIAKGKRTSLRSTISLPADGDRLSQPSPIRRRDGYSR